jgi:hypothetical protein
MNKKSQFFIVSIVLFSMALTTIIYLLTIPAELSKNDMQSQMRDYDDFYSSLKTLRQLSMSINNYWPKSQPNRLSFQAANINQDYEKNQLFLMNLQLDDSAVGESFYLSGNGEKMPFSISQSGPKSYLIGFKDSINPGKSKEYYLFFNKMADSQIYLADENKASDYYETGQTVNYESNAYTAVLNKSSGEILSLKLTGTDYETMKIGAKSNDNSQSGCSSNYSFISYSNNVLSINFTCLLGTVSLIQNYDFHPDFFSVSQDFNILYYGFYNLSLNANSSLNSLATNIGVNESISQPELTYYNSKYASLFYQNYGTLLIGNDSNPYIITSPNNITVDYRLNSSSFSPGLYSQKIIVVPYYNNYTYSLRIADNYFYNPTNSLILSKNEFLSYFKLSFLNILSSSFNTMLFFINSTYSNSRLASISADSKYALSEFSLKNQQLLNKTLLDESGNNMGFSFSTKNYARNSTFPSYLCNNESMNIYNTTYEFMKISGSEILISIKTSGEINAKLYDYSGRLLLNSTFSSDSVISASNPLNGLYRLIISNENSCFKVEVNSPLISANSPIISNSSENYGLFFSSQSGFGLNKTNLLQSPRVILSNAAGILANDSNNFSYTSQTNYYSPTDYYLNITAGMLFLNNSINFGPKESYLSKTYDIKGAILKDYNAIEYYMLNDSEPAVYCAMNYSSGVLNNTGYSIDFENSGFFVNNINWSSSNLFSTDNSIFDFDYMVLNSSLLKSFQFDSSNSVMVLSAINNSNLFAIDFEDVKNSFGFKVNLKINGSADNYYNFNSESGYFNTSKSIDSMAMDKGYNFIAKRDSNAYLAIIFDADDLEQSGSAIVAHNNYIKISLSKYCQKIYLYFTDDYNDLLKIVDGLNNNIIIGNELLSYDYFYSSQNFKSSGTIFG